MSESTRGKLSQTGRAGRVSHVLGTQAGEADASPTLSRIQKGGVGTHV